MASWAAVGLPGVSGKGQEGLSVVPKLATLPIGRTKEEPCPTPVLCWVCCSPGRSVRSDASVVSVAEVATEEAELDGGAIDPGDGVGARVGAGVFFFFFGFSTPFPFFFERVSFPLIIIIWMVSAKEGGAGTA